MPSSPLRVTPEAAFNDTTGASGKDEALMRGANPPNSAGGIKGRGTGGSGEGGDTADDPDGGNAALGTGGGCVGGDTELGTAGGDEGGDGRLGVMDTGRNCVVKSGAEAASQSSTAPQIAHCGLG